MDAHIRKRIAKALLSQQDPAARRKKLLIHSAILLLLFAAHHFFTNWESPLKLIPQTMSAMVMGYMILTILSLRRFPYVAGFIDWAKVREHAGSDNHLGAQNAGDP